MLMYIKPEQHETANDLSYSVVQSLYLGKLPIQLNRIRIIHNIRTAYPYMHERDNVIHFIHIQLYALQFSLGSVRFLLK